MKKPDDSALKTALELQVNKLWQARINHDMKTIYMMVDEEYKKTITEQMFLRKKEYQISGGFKVTSIDIAPDSKSAKVLVKYDAMQMGYKFEPEILEHWLFESGEWHVSFTKRKNPFTMTQEPDVNNKK
ncbi:hypothetical protein [Desulforegula conservatrix]|uniref:hypothetical protein n=1 Tax=Desulforegula conservatrix TaxID=153026 RepID=UPI00041D1653|nr:hypothetical protein [Desulforegula conservatrix]